MALTTKQGITFIAPNSGAQATNPYLVARQSSISTNPKSISFYAFVYWNKESYETEKEPIHVRLVNLDEEALTAFENIPTPSETANLFTVGLGMFYQHLLNTDFKEWELVD